MLREEDIGLLLREETQRMLLERSHMLTQDVFSTHFRDEDTAARERILMAKEEAVSWLNSKIKYWKTQPGMYVHLQPPILRKLVVL
jgi:hypothetical protein